MVIMRRLLYPLKKPSLLLLCWDEEDDDPSLYYQNTKVVFVAFKSIAFESTISKAASKNIIDSCGM